MDHYTALYGALSVDGWAVTFGAVRRASMGSSSTQPLLAVRNITTHPSTAKEHRYHLILPG